MVMDEISQNIVQGIKNKVYGLLDQLGPDDYDYNHIRNVEKVCEDLAIRRNLNIEAARLMGMLHDIGRVVEADSGNQHGKIGAQIGREWLTEEKLDQKWIDIITLGIENHSQKKKVHDVYSELLKDSDSIVHSHEMGESLPKIEKLRVYYASIEKPEILVISSEVFMSTFTSRLYELQKRLNQLNYNDISAELIHELRVDIRTIRSMIWLFHNSKCQKIRRLSQQLKHIFTELEYTRKLSVLYESLLKIGISSKGCIELYQLIQKENRKLEKEVHVRLFRKSNPIVLDYQELYIEDLKEKLYAYKASVEAAHHEDIESLHKLRIAGKKFKYLADEGLLAFQNPKDVQLINDFHASLGRLNDLIENQKMMMRLIYRGEITLKKEEIKRIIETYSAQDFVLRKTIKRQLFKMKKRF